MRYPAERAETNKPTIDTHHAFVRSFGAGVRQLRESHSWSQEQLAEQAILNRSYIGEIERGEVTASLATVAKLARAFRLAPSVLLHHGENTLLHLQVPDAVWWR